MTRVDERQLGVEAAVELRERRHDLEDDDADEHDRQRDQDDRIDQRGDRLARGRCRSTFSYATYRRSTASRLPLRSPAISDAV